MPTPPTLRFTAADSNHAHADWGANCGPHSLAAALGRSLEEIQRDMPFEFRGFMSPTEITKTIQVVQPEFQKPVRHYEGTKELGNGINRIQWEGPWLDPGKPPALAYRYTHYVAHFDGWVLCTLCRTAGWIPADFWRDALRFLHDKESFHITHHWNLQAPKP